MSQVFDLRSTPKSHISTGRKLQLYTRLVPFNTKIIPANLHTRICPDINMQVVLDGSPTFFIV